MLDAPFMAESVRLPVRAGGVTRPRETPMRSLLYFVLPALLTPAVTLHAQCPASGSCFVAHGTPGCNNEACCDLVCAADPFCCNVSWDSLCVGQATDACGCGAAEAGPCLVTHDTPWCNNSECCDAVCDDDPFCCAVEWDKICVGLANTLCLGCGGVLEGSCFEVGPGNCSDADCCTVVCAKDPFCCEQLWDGFCVTEAFSLCTQCGEITAGSCTDTHPTPSCNDLQCCAAVCALDFFCCEVQWDLLCVSGALELCNFCTGDFDVNGLVDSADLANLLAGWNLGGDTDLNADGITGAADLAMLLAAWGDCP
jgi:hypothetical protein